MLIPLDGVLYSSISFLFFHFLQRPKKINIKIKLRTHRQTHNNEVNSLNTWITYNGDTAGLGSITKFHFNYNYNYYHNNYLKSSTITIMIHSITIIIAKWPAVNVHVAVTRDGAKYIQK